MGFATLFSFIADVFFPSRIEKRIAEEFDEIGEVDLFTPEPDSVSPSIPEARLAFMPRVPSTVEMMTALLKPDETGEFDLSTPMEVSKDIWMDQKGALSILHVQHTTPPKITYGIPLPKTKESGLVYVPYVLKEEKPEVIEAKDWEPHKVLKSKYAMTQIDSNWQLCTLRQSEIPQAPKPDFYQTGYFTEANLMTKSRATLYKHRKIKRDNANKLDDSGILMFKPSYDRIDKILTWCIEELKRKSANGNNK